MSGFNASFWEIPTSSTYIENVPAERNLWFETETDRERRYALQDFFASVLPVVRETVDACLTSRQREVVRLYYFEGKSQTDIAAALDLSQSTVSRHLFGTMRDGKRVGGAVAKLRKNIRRLNSTRVSQAINTLDGRLRQQPS